MPRQDRPWMKVELDFFFDDERFVELSAATRLLYLALWGMCVRNRRGWLTAKEANPRVLARRLMIHVQTCRVSVSRLYKNDLIQVLDDGTLVVPGVRHRHKNLRDWKEPSSSHVVGRVEERRVEESTDSSAPPSGADQKAPESPKRKAKKSLPEDGPAYQIATTLLEAIRSHRPAFEPKFGEVDIQRWARDADRMLRLDGRTVEDAEAVIDWVHRGEDHFWRSNILSTAKLRQKFDQLAIRMEGEQHGQARTTGPKRSEPFSGAHSPERVAAFAAAEARDRRASQASKGNAENGTREAGGAPPPDPQ